MSVLLIVFLVLVLAAVFVVNTLCAAQIERRNPPSGTFTTINGAKLHYLYLPQSEPAELPPLVFIHGASGNLRDQAETFLPALRGHASMLFIDRPGLGWSERAGTEQDTPDGQAKAILALMECLRIDQPIVVGHSKGAATAIAMALESPNCLKGMLLLSPASHPWPGRAISWYNHLAAAPVVGSIFARTFVSWFGQSRLKSGSECVFAPDPLPDQYVERAAIELVLRPDCFCANARDLTRLHAYFRKTASHYSRIKLPTIIVSGQSDILAPEQIHAANLAQELPGCRWLSVKGLGHKPDYVARPLCLATIQSLSGQKTDLEKVRQETEQQLLLAKV